MGPARPRALRGVPNTSRTWCPDAPAPCLDALWWFGEQAYGMNYNGMLIHRGNHDGVWLGNVMQLIWRRRRTRLVLLAGAFALHVLMYVSTHLYLPMSSQVFLVWDAIRVVLGIVLPVALAVVLLMWISELPLAEWSMADLLLLNLGVLLLIFLFSEMGYWVQETRLRIPGPLFGVLLRASTAVKRPLLVLTMLFDVYVLWRMWSQWRK